MDKRPLPKVTITHHDFKEPKYDPLALKEDLKRSRRHVTILQTEIDHQKAYQKQLLSLLKKFK